MPRIHAAHLLSNIHARMDSLSRSSWKTPLSEQNPKKYSQSMFRLIDLNARAGKKQTHEAAMCVHVADRKNPDVNALMATKFNAHVPFKESFFDDQKAENA